VVLFLVEQLVAIIGGKISGEDGGRKSGRAYYGNISRLFLVLVIGGMLNFGFLRLH